MRIENLRILRSYGIKNDLQWVMRDILQNFYDAEKKAGAANPFENIEIQFTDMEDGTGTIAIHGKQYFELEYLLYMGATTKAGDHNQIGEKGEGIKVSTLIAMRDYDFHISYYSASSKSSWSALATWQTVNIGGKEDAELCFSISEQKNTESQKTGVYLLGPIEHVNAVKEMDFSSWFAHDNNKNLLESNKICEGIYTANGIPHLFLAGLDRGVDPRLTFTYRIDRKLKNDNDRDRKALSHEALKEALVAILSDENLPEQVYKTIIEKKLKDCIGGSFDPEVVALKRNPKFAEFFQKVYEDRMHLFTYSAKDYYGAYSEKTLQRLGVMQVTEYDLHQLVRQFTKPIEVLIDGLAKSTEVSMSVVQARKGKLLFDLVQLAGLRPLPIRVFKPTEEESRINGTYNETYVRLNERLFTDRSFGEVLAIYVHELAHRFGPDGSAAFSDALTRYMGIMFGATVHPTERGAFLRKIVEYDKRWNSYKVV